MKNFFSADPIKTRIKKEKESLKKSIKLSEDLNKLRLEFVGSNEKLDKLFDVLGDKKAKEFFDILESSGQIFEKLKSIEANLKTSKQTLKTPSYGPKELEQDQVEKHQPEKIKLENVLKSLGDLRSQSKSNDLNIKIDKIFKDNKVKFEDKFEGHYNALISKIKNQTKDLRKLDKTTDSNFKNIIKELDKNYKDAYFKNKTSALINSRDKLVKLTSNFYNKPKKDKILKTLQACEIEINNRINERNLSLEQQEHKKLSDLYKTFMEYNGRDKALDNALDNFSKNYLNKGIISEKNEVFKKTLLNINNLLEEAILKRGDTNRTDKLMEFGFELAVVCKNTIGIDINDSPPAYEPPPSYEDVIKMPTPISPHNNTSNPLKPEIPSYNKEIRVINNIYGIFKDYDKKNTQEKYPALYNIIHGFSSKHSNKTSDDQIKEIRKAQSRIADLSALNPGSNSMNDIMRLSLDISTRIVKVFEEAGFEAYIEEKRPITKPRTIKPTNNTELPTPKLRPDLQNKNRQYTVEEMNIGFSKYKREDTNKSSVQPLSSSASRTNSNPQIPMKSNKVKIVSPDNERQVKNLTAGFEQSVLDAVNQAKKDLNAKKDFSVKNVNVKETAKIFTKPIEPKGWDRS